MKTPDNKLFSDVGSDLKHRIGLMYKQRHVTELQQQRAELAAARRQRALELMVQQPQQQLPVGGVSIK